MNCEPIHRAAANESNVVPTSQQISPINLRFVCKEKKSLPLLESTGKGVQPVPMAYSQQNFLMTRIIARSEGEDGIGLILKTTS